MYFFWQVVQGFIVGYVCGWGFGGFGDFKNGVCVYQGGFVLCGLYYWDNFSNYYMYVVLLKFLDQ